MSTCSRPAQWGRGLPRAGPPEATLPAAVPHGIGVVLLRLHARNPNPGLASVPELHKAPPTDPGHAQDTASPNRLQG